MEQQRRPAIGIQGAVKAFFREGDLAPLTQVGHQITGGKHTSIGRHRGCGCGRFAAQADAFQIGPGEKPGFGQGQPAQHRPAQNKGSFSLANSKAPLPVTG